MDLVNEVVENRHKGELMIENGKYTGDIKNGKRDGVGQMVWEDGSFYDGFWKENH